MCIIGKWPCRWNRPRERYAGVGVESARKAATASGTVA